MEIYARTIPHRGQKYETVGDYDIFDGLVNIRISEMANQNYEWLVQLHENIEAWLVYQTGIRVEAITAFDIMFEEERARGLHGLNDEPGDDPRAPYYKQHQIASAHEKLLCVSLGIDWCDYEKAVNSL